MAARERPTRVTMVEGGPILVDGPVDLELPDGTHVQSNRPVVALCACRRSKRYPFCDTSHRRKVRTSTPERAGRDAGVRAAPAERPDRDAQTGTGTGRSDDSPAAKAAES